MKDKDRILILGIESSCDETAASILENDKVLANVIAGQDIHQNYGGVVPELASRAHQQNIVPVVHEALTRAKVNKNDLDAVAFTAGPGLLGALLVGTSFAKGLALGLDIPLLNVNHMQAHVLAHFIRNSAADELPALPMLCLTVSGGHTQLLIVRSPLEFELIGQTTDDAAGEAFDKAAKVMGLPYPGGPLIDKLASQGDENMFRFPVSSLPGLDFSFSGLKTSLLYFLRDHLKKDPQFLEKYKADIAASFQKAIIDALLSKLIQASEETGIKCIAIAGGVSANSGLRNRLQEVSKKRNWELHVPAFEYCTDNAAMIGIAGYYLFKAKRFAPKDISASARMPL